MLTLLRRFFAAILAIIAFGAGGAVAQTQSVIEDIKQAGVIRVGLSIFHPWAMYDKNGELIGFELDIARQLAADMGVEVEFVLTDWEQMIPSLNAGDFDVIISGMSITPSRNLVVNFTDPYAFSGMTLLANRALTEGFRVEDFNHKDVIFTARRGATSATVIGNLFPDAQLLLMDEDGADTEEVLAGRAHATMAAEPTPSDAARDFADILHVPFSHTYLATGEGFGVRKGDHDALNFFNNWIAHYWVTGWLQQRNNYWFRGNEWAEEIE